jgi:NTP pyrophosphatase (non-canonical NTP hydrolase)
MTLAELQSQIARMYGKKDADRGKEGTFLWLSEEVGELAGALRLSDQEALAAEFADVLAWLATLANVSGVDLTSAFHNKYGGGCPGCNQVPCICSRATKP